MRASCWASTVYLGLVTSGPAYKQAVGGLTSVELELSRTAVVYMHVGAVYFSRGRACLPVGLVNILESTSPVGRGYPTNSASARDRAARLLLLANHFGSEEYVPLR